MFHSHPNSSALRQFITGVGLTLVCLSGQTLGQGFFPQQRPSSQHWATTPPAVPDQVSAGEVLDHSSMSPDSWSAPLTGAVVTGPAYSNSFQPNQFQSNQFQSNQFVPPASNSNIAGSRSTPPRVNVVPFQVSSPTNPIQVSAAEVMDHSSMSPDSWSAPSTGATVTGPSYSNSNIAGSSLTPPNVKTVPLQVAAPTIPDFQNDLGPGRSLIRQPQKQLVDQRRRSTTEAKSILTGSKSGESTSPFRASNFSRGDGAKSATPPNNPANNTKSEIGTLEATPLMLTSPKQNFPVQQQPGEFGSMNSPALSPSAQPALPPSVMPQGATRQAYPPPAAVQNHSPQRYPLGQIQSRANSSLAPSDQRIKATESRMQLGYFNKQPAVQGQATTPVSAMSVQPSLFSTLPNYRPDLGHRTAAPTYRGRDHDSGQKFDFEEKKKEYPPFSEILATGRYFGSASVLFMQPAFQQNSAITQFNSAVPTATFASTEAFDFDYETAPRLRFGFESKYGPGIEFDYWQFDQGSNVSSFVSDGTTAGELSTWMLGPSRWTRLEATNAGERIDAIHSIDVETIQAMVFKEIKFPISRLNGMFGFQYASIFQTLDATLTDAGGAVLGSVRSTSDMRAYGPKFKFEYYRPIGHTKLEFMTSFGGGVMFGERDQIVQNTQTPAFSSFGADEYILNSDFYSGIQFKKMFAENRGFYGRLGFSYQSWVGGGTAVNAQDDFGLRGFSFDVGYNR